MSSGPHYAYQERTDLYYYTERNASLLAHDEVLADAQEYDRNDYIYWTIGELSCHLAQVGEDQAALQLADRLLSDIDADEEGALLTWSSLAEKGTKIAETKLREAMGLTHDANGNTLLPESTDMQDGRTFYRLLSLYTFGDKSIAPHLHHYVENLDDQSAHVGARLAAKIYEAGDESAYELVKASAERARKQVLDQQPTDSELRADDASDFSQIAKGIARALSPSRSEMERAYAQTDIALRYFAKSLLEKGDIEKADEVQALMLSGFDNAWLCAQRFELGHDPKGTYAQAAKDYLAIYGEDSGSHSLEITDALVRGGDSETIKDYESIYDASIDSSNISASAAAKNLVALHLSGDRRAHDRLIELIPKDSWFLISSLEDMGYKDEALTAAKKAFREQPNFATASRVLGFQYDAEAMDAVQNGVRESTYDLATAIHSRAKHLGSLAAHIIEIEQR